MNADQRLDQLEPLVAQNLAVADRHTAQLKQLVNLGIQQSENMQFALQGILELKEQQQVINEQMQAVMGQQQVANEQLQVVLEQQPVITDLKEKQQVMDTKLDRILDLLGGRDQ